MVLFVLLVAVGVVFFLISLLREIVEDFLKH